MVVVTHVSDRTAGLIASAERGQGVEARKTMHQAGCRCNLHAREIAFSRPVGPSRVERSFDPTKRVHVAQRLQNWSTVGTGSTISVFTNHTVPCT